MLSTTDRLLSRRALLETAVAGAGSLGVLPHAWANHAAPASDFRLRATSGVARLLSDRQAETPVWCYNDRIPGPEIRVRQGDQLRVVVDNDLAEPSTVHWHGMRVPNPMDGVAYLTQPPIEPGDSYVYEFQAVDAGTFWYHPHHRSFEQVGRGLYGPLIVEEHAPVRVDREVTWLLDDWRLTPEHELSNDFGNRHDSNHGGRVGNTVTINGRAPEDVSVRKGERIRLRLINAANARIFSLDFADLEPVVIAHDGQPVPPHQPADGRVVLGPGMRMDLIVDVSVDDRASVIDRFYEGLEYLLVDFVCGDTALRGQAPDWPVALAPNPIPEPDLDVAFRHEIVFNGGMMGGMVMQDMRGGMDAMASMMNGQHADNLWFINGVAASGHIMDPFLTLDLGRPYVFTMTNETAWHHPMHLHGHSFRVLSRDDVPTVYREWQDTVLMNPREKIEIAFVADNPGDWMFHCHILEHQASGMMGVIRVA